MTSRKSITVKDVAAAANVSRATAARALNGYGYVGHSAAQRVQEAAARLGYRGNRVAQALRQGGLPIVGFMAGDIQNPFFARIAHDAELELRRSRHNLLIASSDEDIGQERELLDNLRALNVRGIIVAPASDEDSHHLIRMAREGMPLVLIDRLPSGMPCDSITVDNESCAREAVEFLAGNGHRRIALIREESRIITARERFEGYIGALKSRGINVDDRFIAVSNSTVKDAIDATTHLFSQPERPTALFTVDSLMTTGALLALRSMGLSVPHDVSLVGFDDFDLATFTDPPITVVAQPVSQIGALAVDMLLDRIQGNNEPPRHVRLPAKLIVRNSVASPASALAR